MTATAERRSVGEEKGKDEVAPPTAAVEPPAGPIGMPTSLWLSGADALVGSALEGGEWLVAAARLFGVQHVEGLPAHTQKQLSAGPGSTRSTK